MRIMSDQTPDLGPGVSTVAPPAPQEPETNSRLAAPADDSDTMRTYGAGWTEVKIDGHAYQLRRPMIGELRKLRLAIEAAEDQIADERIKTQDIQARANDEIQTVVADKDMADHDRNVRLNEIRIEARAAGDKLNQLADDARIRWWTLVFDTLSISQPKRPPDWPSWILDPEGCGRVLNHWRQNPLARG